MTAPLATLAAPCVLLVCATASAADPFWPTAYPSTDGFDLQTSRVPRRRCASPSAAPARPSFLVPWRDGAFGAAENIDGNVELQSVSCTTSTSCEAVDHNDKVFRSPPRAARPSGRR